MRPWSWPWRWRRGDTDESQPTVVEQLTAERYGATDVALGAVQASVALYVGAVAAADYEGRYPLPAADRASLVADYLTAGEALRRVDVSGVAPILTPCLAVDVRGDSPDPREWNYQVTVNTPRGTLHGTYEASRILHWRCCPLPAAPWRGVSPLRRAPALAALAGAIERSLVGEHSLPTARIATLNVPWRQQGAQKAQLQESLPLVKLRGDGTVVAQSLDRGIEKSGPIASRIGAEPDGGSVTLRAAAGREVASCFGIPPGLVLAEAGSAQAIRDLRQTWLRGPVTAMLDELAGLLRVAFDDPTIRFRLAALEDDRADAESRRRQRRATSIATLMRGGLKVEQATSLHDGV